MIPDAHTLRRPEPPISNARLAMLLFVASEAMLFTGLITGYVVLGFGSNSFKGMRALPLGLAPLAVAVLVASSAVLIMAQRSIRDGAAGRSNAAARWSMLALLLGTIFLGIQATEWMSLLDLGMLPGSAVNAGMLYVVGGVHGLHVLVGLVLLAVFAVRARSVPSAPATRTAATITALYWHFVTIVWITLFLMLYIL
jgi:cytochrome c oxidase subunit III